MRFNVLLPIGAAGNLGIPPDGESFGLQCLDQLNKPGPVLGLVRHKHVGRADHWSPRKGRATRLRRASECTSGASSLWAERWHQVSDCFERKAAISVFVRPERMKECGNHLKSPSKRRRRA